MHSRQAFIFALYRAQGVNRGYGRGKGLAFVTSEIWGSQGYILFIRRHCIGYVVYRVPYTLPHMDPQYPTLYPVPCTLYLTPYRSAVPHTLPCIGLQYPIPCILYPMPDATYTRNKPLRHVHRRGRRYRTKKYPARREPHGVCNERDVNPYSVEGVEVRAPMIPAIVIVTSPINIEPND